MANLRLFLLATLALFLISQPCLRQAVAQDDDDDYVPAESENLPPEDEPLPDTENNEETVIREEDYEAGAGADDDDAIPDGDDGDVIALTNETLPEHLAKSKQIMVEFYAPWCGHCKALAPEYKQAAARLKEFGVVLAKVDVTKYEEVGSQYGVEGYPTIIWFADGKNRTYNSARTEKDLVAWVKKRIGFAVLTLNSEDEAKKAVEENGALTVAYFAKLEGPEVAVYAEAGTEVEGAQFVQTDKPELAKFFGLTVDNAEGKPVIAMVKKEEEKFVPYDGEVSKDALVQFAEANKRPLFITFSEDSAQVIFGGDINRQVFVFAPSDEHSNVLPAILPVAKLHLGKAVFVYMNASDESVDSAREFFGVNANETKIVLLSTEKKQEGEKFFMKAELTEDNVKAFMEDYIAGKLLPFFKSDPIPEKNDGPVKVVVGNSWESIVLDETKDVMVEIYAPWCGHCKALAPVYKKLGKKFKGVDSVVIAKMDGTTNEYPGVNVEGFPTILFYPANSKSNPVPVDAERKLKPLIKFIKKHASIPFEFPAKAPKEDAATAEEKEAQAEAKEAAAEAAQAEKKEEL